eukprot:8020371-Alexandrium_andersonii.AAC.1
MMGSERSRFQRGGETLGASASRCASAQAAHDGQRAEPLSARWLDVGCGCKPSRLGASRP